MTNNFPKDNSFFFIAAAGIVTLMGFFLWQHFDTKANPPKVISEDVKNVDAELSEIARKKREAMGAGYTGFASGEDAKKFDSASTANSKEFKKLVGNFVGKKDKFSKTTWYTHKNQKGAYRTTLLVHVNNDGWVYLESQYHKDDWIFHTHFKAIVDGVQIVSPIVETYNEHNKTETGDGVWENISYVDSGITNIIEKIATSKDPVEIRFVGRQYNHDFKLPPKDKQAIKDAWQLAELLKSGLGED